MDALTNERSIKYEGITYSHQERGRTHILGGEVFSILMGGEDQNGSREKNHQS